MPYNGVGNFSLAQPAFVAGTTISSAAVNSDLSDIATNGLSKCVTTDGQNTITGQLKFPNGSAAAPSISFASDLTTGMYYAGSGVLAFSIGGTRIVRFVGNNFGSQQSGNAFEISSPTGIVFPNPVGVVTDFAGATPPAGWLLCYGQSLLIASYPELFTAISTTYGGDGVTTFFAPDCRGRATYGQDNMGGSAANRITVAGGNFDGTVLGGSGGVQNKVIAIGNLPASIPYTDTGHTHTVFPLCNTAAAGGVNPGNAFMGNNGASSIYSGGNSQTMGAAQVSSTVISTITINSGGANTALPVLSPAIIFNKIIYAGRV